MKEFEAVNTKLLKRWLEANEPQAVEKLAVSSRVSSTLIRKIMKGHAPRNGAIRWALAEALKVPETDLFPPKKSA